MAIMKADVCSNCRKLVPDQCDGKTYRVEQWRRLVCLGSDGENFIDIRGERRFKIVVGHGHSYDVPLTPA